MVKHNTGTYQHSFLLLTAGHGTLIGNHEPVGWGEKSKDTNMDHILIELRESMYYMGESSS